MGEARGLGLNLYTRLDPGDEGNEAGITMMS